jgi:ER lumen protein retaining receptor
MLNDYKPTHDPNIDTFKVYYLLAGSAVLALLFPHKYTFLEVSASINPKVYRGYKASDRDWNS